jgi:hypothetical protein
MIYSKWKPSSGGYEYYEGNDKSVPMGDDLPKPKLPIGTEIGVASIECGRKLPSAASYKGSGTQAIGLITPSQNSSSLGSLGDLIPSAPVSIAGALGIILGGLIARSKK